MRRAQEVKTKPGMVMGIARYMSSNAKSKFNAGFLQQILTLILLAGIPTAGFNRSTENRFHLL
ncbi:MAG: hypothetical protein AVDCRST_MAG74-235 [uncultured Pyrinomonadaceae bacterium]|uniref:Uncharacterized protein n=1 Tax=uncultured Pyrinomonadaceae bacterium TaxID=2283094 RepID=A0A6J4N6H8_9BACT|nr:MAG: hypothetical protein AVDCRST_MAG74-235 [uncultured Pyrinomonadaceae bacterium]